MLTSILVALDGSACSFTATTLALEWARRFDARLLALGIVAETLLARPDPATVGASGHGKARDGDLAADAYGRVAGLLADFRVRATAAGTHVEIVEEVGDPAERILWEARRTDVVVLGREVHFNLDTPERRDVTLAQVVRSCPRPMVVVPQKPAEGAGILVAFGGGREAARTLQLFALLGLAAGETLDVLTIHREAAEARVIARAASDFLSAHGLRHRVHTCATSAAPSDVLLDEVQSRRPRLLVLGAHRDHPLRDLFATSVTRAVLRACPVPLFVGA